MTTVAAGWESSGTHSVIRPKGKKKKQIRQEIMPK